MPWDIVKHNGQFCLRKQGTTEIVKGSCHSDKAKTQAMMRAMYANEGKSMEGKMENESLTYYGGAVKALGGGKVGGYLIIFTGPDSPDLQNEYFTKSTDFFIENGEVRPILYRHGANPVIKSRKLGKGTLTIDDVGVFLEGELNLRDNYEKAIYKLAEDGKLGWSSGSMGHLVTKKPNGKSLEIITWPIGEASLTPNPVEGRTMAIPVKSLDEIEILDDFVKSIEPIKEETSEPKQLSLDAFPALRDCIVPSDLKGLDYRSEAVGAAVDELLTHWRMVTVAVKSYAAVLEDNARLRFERDGRPVSKKNQEWTEAAIQRFERLLVDHQEVTSYLRDIQKSFDRTHLQERVLEEKVRFELARVAALTGYQPTDTGDE